MSVASPESVRAQVRLDPDRVGHRHPRVVFHEPGGVPAEGQDPQSRGGIGAWLRVNLSLSLSRALILWVCDGRLSCVVRAPARSRICSATMRARYVRKPSRKTQASPAYMKLATRCAIPLFITYTQTPLSQLQIEDWCQSRFPVVALSSPRTEETDAQSLPPVTACNGTAAHDHLPVRSRFVKRTSVITHICSAFLLAGLIRLAVVYGVLDLTGARKA